LNDEDQTNELIAFVSSVEFGWFQVNPYQSYRLRIHEDQFHQAQQHIRSKSNCVNELNAGKRSLSYVELMDMTFEDFIVLIDPIFANEAAEVSTSVLRSSFDNLFDQNSNGTIEIEEFESLSVLLHGWIGKKKHLSDDNLRQTFSNRFNHISFQGRAI
jgi:hypothetical protein